MKAATPDQKTKRNAKENQTFLMQCVKTSGFGNTMIIGSISIRMAATLVIAVLGAVALWQTDLFHANWVAFEIGRAHV